MARILLTYKVTAQGFDEPCHIAAAIEFLDKGTYTLDPVHPPLTRIAIGIPLYLAGERFPHWPASDARIRNYNDVGNSVLFDDGHYLRNLSLARSAILPFFVLGVILVFLWTRQEFGDLSGAMAALLFTTLPIVLAFSGLAYTDLPTACMQFAALFAFTAWLRKPSLRSTLVLGFAVALAFLSKLTTLLFLPSAIAAIWLAKWLVERSAGPPPRAGKANWMGKLGVAFALAVVVVWAGYGFSVGHIREEAQISPESMPSFQHFPGPVRSVARSMVLRDPVLPAPALFRGIATSWALNQDAPPAYLLGKVRKGGWWYFFLVGVGVKTPLPFLLLCVAGIFAVLKRPVRWTAVAPAVSVLAILFVTMFVKYNAGVRHVMVVFPLLAVIAGSGCGLLWQSAWEMAPVGTVMPGGLAFLAMPVESERSSGLHRLLQPAGGPGPSRVLVTGCDLDCGQDLFRLSQALREGNISHPNIAVWSSADMSRMNLPRFDIPPPFQPVTGWFAISLRSLRMGDFFTPPTLPAPLPGWVESQPVAKIGKTILLYYIPPGAAAEPGAATGPPPAFPR